MTEQTTSGAIRMASGADHLAMARLRWAWRIGKGEQPTGSFEAFAADLASWLEGHASSHIGLVALADTGEVVGMGWLAIVERVPGPGSWSRLSGYVQSLYVDPAHRGHGLGQALTEAIVDEARQRGLGYVAVHPSERSFPIYRRAGFTDTDGVLERRF